MSTSVFTSPSFHMEVAHDMLRQLRNNIWRGLILVTVRDVASIFTKNSMWITAPACNIFQPQCCDYGSPSSLPRWMKYIRGLFLGTMIVVDEDKAELFPMLYDEEDNGCAVEGMWLVHFFVDCQYSLLSVLSNYWWIEDMQSSLMSMQKQFRWTFVFYCGAASYEKYWFLLVKQPW